MARTKYATFADSWMVAVEEFEEDPPRGYEVLRSSRVIGIITRDGDLFAATPTRSAGPIGVYTTRNGAKAALVRNHKKGTTK